jgi:hypothetical protein
LRVLFVVVVVEFGGVVVGYNVIVGVGLFFWMALTQWGAAEWVVALLRWQVAAVGSHNTTGPAAARKT